MCIGLVFTCEGIPLGYEAFAGNRTDVTTVEEIIGTMERRYGQSHQRCPHRSLLPILTVRWRPRQVRPRSRKLPRRLLIHRLSPRVTRRCWPRSPETGHRLRW